ncbi:hypothetical protein SARC_16981, partial [Sphaeroforma arctica JP610]
MQTLPDTFLDIDDHDHGPSHHHKDLVHVYHPVGCERCEVMVEGEPRGQERPRVQQHSPHARDICGFIESISKPVCVYLQ